MTYFLANTLIPCDIPLVFAPKAHLHSSAKDGLGVPGFSYVRGNADFGIFENIWIFPDRNGVRARRSRSHHWLSSCPLDSLRCVGGHWSRQETLDRPKLIFAAVTRPHFRFWSIFDDFLSILMIFSDFS